MMSQCHLSNAPKIKSGNMCSPASAFVLQNLRFFHTTLARGCAPSNPLKAKSSSLRLHRSWTLLSTGMVPVDVLQRTLHHQKEKRQTRAGRHSHCPHVKRRKKPLAAASSRCPTQHLRLAESAHHCPSRGSQSYHRQAYAAPVRTAPPKQSLCSCRPCIAASVKRHWQQPEPGCPSFESR